MLDMETLKSIAQLSLPIISFIYTWLATRQKDDSEYKRGVVEEFKKFGADVGGIEDRLIKVETRMDHMPTQEEFAILQGDMRAVNEALRPMSRSLERIEDYLLKEKS